MLQNVIATLLQAVAAPTTFAVVSVSDSGLLTVRVSDASGSVRVSDGATIVVRIGDSL